MEPASAIEFRPALALRLNVPEFDLKTHADGCRGTLQRMQGHTVIVGIQQPVELRAARLHARLGQVLRFHRLLKLVGENRLDRLVLRLLVAAIFTQQVF